MNRRNTIQQHDLYRNQTESESLLPNTSNTDELTPDEFYQSEAKSYTSLDHMTNIIDQISLSIFNEVADEDIFFLLEQLNPAYINAFSSKGQTLLYTACRAGRLEIIKKLVLFRGIKLGGAQNIPLKSTPLHGANWGGHIEAIAMLLVLGAVPEENSVTPDGRGLPPSEEGNANLPEFLLEQLQILWAEFYKQGASAMYKYLPTGWSIPKYDNSDMRNDSFSAAPRTRLVSGIISKSSNISIVSESSSNSPSPRGPKVAVKVKTERPHGQSFPSATKSKSLVDLIKHNEIAKTGLTNSQGSQSLTVTQRSTPNMPSIIPNFDVIPKYPPQYKKFPYLFYWKDGKDSLHLYDLFTTSKLNNAYARKVYIVKTTIKGKKYEINLDTMYHTSVGDKKQKVRNVEMYPRIPLWFWRDDDGTLRAYDEKTNLEIWRRQIQGKNSLRITIGKWEYELFINEKIQKNVKSNTERIMWDEDDLAMVQRWWEPQIPLEITNGKKVELVSIEPYSTEWEQVSQLFHLTMPSKIRSSMIDRVSGKSGKFKDCHSITKIEKIVNPTLREHWEHELQMLKKNHTFNDPSTEYVKLLFHGTSKTPPKIIYEADKGWKISYSRDDSLWGRGLYFAQDSIYTHNYSYKTMEGTRKVFLAEVIVGDAIHSEEDSTLRQPPMKDETLNIRYDSVIGLRHDATWIWITYDDARAYPTYLIEYKST